MEVSFCFRHGGQLVNEDGVIYYKGGTMAKEEKFDEDKLSRLDLLWFIWDLGYEKCGGIYYRAINGQFVELCKDGDVLNYVESLGVGDQEKGIIYVDSPTEELENWKRIDESLRGTHKSRATVVEVSNMCIKRTPKVEVGGSAKQLESGRKDAKVGSISHVSEESNSSSDSDSLESIDEDSEVDLEDNDGSEADVDTEVTKIVKEGRSKLRTERSKKHREVLQQRAIQLGPVGIDKGLESYVKSGNPYSGLLAGDEDYIGSSNVDSFASDEEYENGGEIQQTGRRRNVRVHYDPECEEPLWELGMVFKSAKEFREAAIYYAVKKNVQAYYQQNQPNKVRVRCSYVDNDGNKCPWLLYASEDNKSGDFVVKNYNPVHVCLRQNTNNWCDAKFVAKYFKKDIIENPRIRLWLLQHKVKDKFKVYTMKNICRKASSIVVNSMVGDCKEEFKRLYDYRDCILQTNPGSTCVVDVNIENETGKHIFRGMYVFFSAIKEGFKHGCRKCIGVDGCFLKGVHKGQLLSAVTKDANNQIYPLAWAVVHNETADSWTWFLELLVKDLCLGNGTRLTIVTDMQKGLDKAVRDVLPNAEHRECARHILANWAKKWRGIERRKCFWRCAKSTFEMQLKENLRELSELGNETIVHDLLRYNINRWCRVYFKFDSVCDTVDNNFCESFNGWILAPRHKNIISMLEEIRTMIMTRHTKMQRFPSTWITEISPIAYQVLDDNAQKAMNCYILWNGDDGYEIVDGQYTHVVSLTNKSFSCRAWSLKGIPCPHAITAMHNKGLDPLNFVDIFYHKDTFMKTYSFLLQPMPNMKMIPESSSHHVEPPSIKPLPGRPKRNRRKPRDEVKKCGKASKNGVRMTCSYCKQKDHNKTSCKKRKLDEIAQKNGQSMPEPSNPSSQGPIETRKKVADASKASKATTHAKGKAMSGYGLFISEKTGFASFQNGNPQQNRAIPLGVSSLKSSAIVTGDIGFQPTKRKWKGKDVVLQDDLVYAQAKKQAENAKTSTQMRETQNRSLLLTEQQRMRAITNKARAESILVRTGGISTQPTATMTKSKSSVATSKSQPPQQTIWKF